MILNRPAIASFVKILFQQDFEKEAYSRQQVRDQHQRTLILLATQIAILLRALILSSIGLHQTPNSLFSTSNDLVVSYTLTFGEVFINQ